MSSPSPVAERLSPTHRGNGNGETAAPANRIAEYDDRTIPADTDTSYAVAVVPVFGVWEPKRPKQTPPIVLSSVDLRIARQFATYVNANPSERFKSRWCVVVRTNSRSHGVTTVHVHEDERPADPSDTPADALLQSGLNCKDAHAAAIEFNCRVMDVTFQPRRWAVVVKMAEEDCEAVTTQPETVALHVVTFPGGERKPFLTASTAEAAANVHARLHDGERPEISECVAELRPVTIENEE